MTGEPGDGRKHWGRAARGANPEEGGKFHEVLILLQQHPWPLAPGLSRRPYLAAYGLGPAVFTIRAK
ncbi:MAG: hypothetical protein ACREJW_08865, partial [Candidatus Methylomirabilales bacterium]